MSLVLKLRCNCNALSRNAFDVCDDTACFDSSNILYVFAMIADTEEALNQSSGWQYTTIETSPCTIKNDDDRERDASQFDAHTRPVDILNPKLREVPSFFRTAGLGFGA